MSGIHLRCKVFPGAFLLYLCKPRFSIDRGPEQLCAWGDNAIPVPPGRHGLQVWFRYITGPTNVADMVLDVPPGQPVQVVYKTRWLMFLPGKLELVGPVVGPYGAAPVPQMPQVPQAAPGGWNPDPSGRHQFRWWDGTRWTSTVADNGVTSDSPL